MKNIAVFLICVFLIFAFSSCDENYTYLSTNPTTELSTADFDALNNKNKAEKYKNMTVEFIVTGLISKDKISAITVEDKYKADLGSIVIVQYDNAQKLGTSDDDIITVTILSVDLDASPTVIYASHIE